MCVCLEKSVLEGDDLVFLEGIGAQLPAVQVFPVHVHGGDGAVVVGGVVVDAPVGVAAGAVNGQIQLSVAQQHTAPLHLHGFEDVEKLADALHLRFPGCGVQLHKGGLDEPGGGGGVAGQAQGAHAPGIGLQRQAGGEAVDRIGDGQAHEIAQVVHMVIESGVIRQHPHRIVVDFDSGFHGFQGDGAFPVGEDPVQGRQGQLRAEMLVEQIDPLKQHPGLGHGGAPAQDPGDQLEGGDIVLSVLEGLVVRVFREIQSGHAQTLFIGGIVVQGVSIRHIGHADHGIVGFHSPHFPERKGIIPGRDRDGLQIGIFQIQIPAKVVVFRLVGYGCAHGKASLRGFWISIPQFPPIFHNK